MFVRVWEGTRVLLYMGSLAALLGLAVGVPYGAVSGLIGGRTDNVMQRIVEILNGVPNLIVAILAMLVLKPGILTISISLAVFNWTIMARIIRPHTFGRIDWYDHRC